MQFDQRQAVADCPWFQAMPAQAIDRLHRAAELRRFPVNSYLYTLGQPTTEVYGLLSGRVRTSISSAQGHEFALIEREAGAWFGEPGLAGDDKRVLDAMIIETAEVLVIPRDVVLEIGERHPVLYKNLFLYNQSVLRGFHELMAGILFYPLHARLAGRLLHLAAEHGETTAKGVRVTMKVSQNDFGRLALGSRQRVNKIFRDWNSRGIVVSDEESLLIPDIAALKREMVPFD